MKLQLGGYAGKYLCIDVNSRSVKARSLDSRLLEYVGGLGMATRVFMDAYHPGLRAEDAANPLVIFTGPLTGTPVPTASRTAVVSLSPQTNALGISNFGGFWGTALKHAGWDGIVIEGASNEWISVVIDGEDVVFLPSEELVGKDTWSTQDQLAQRLDAEHPDKVHVLAVGPAGEQGVHYASLTADYFSSASRCGMGAVMGQKRVKAIVVRDCDGNIPVVDVPSMRAKSMHAFEKHRSMRVPFGLDGYTGFVNRCQQNGWVPNRNFHAGRSSLNLDPQIAKNFIVSSPDFRKCGRSCHGCPNSCFLSVELQTGKYRGLKNTGLIPAAVLCWGGRCGISTWEGVWKCEEVSDRLGVDFFSASTVVSCAIDLFKSGRITRDDTGGVALDWGDEAAILELLHRIAHGQGEFARLAGKGSDALARSFGGFSSTVRGLEMWGADPRLFPLSYSIGDLFSFRGGDNIPNTHNMHFLLHSYSPDVEQAVIGDLQIPRGIKEEIFPSSLIPNGPRGLAHLVRWGEEFNCLLSSLGICMLEQDILHFSLAADTHYGKLYESVTGLTLDADAITKLGDRIMNSYRVIAGNVGFNAAHDSWPDRFYEEPITEGPGRGRVVNRSYVQETIRQYYDLRGWDPETGMPKANRLVL